METCLVQWSHTQAGQTTESVIHPSGVEIVDKEALMEVNVQVRGRSYDWLFFLEEGSLAVPSEKIRQNFSGDCSSPCDGDLQLGCSIVTNHCRKSCLLQNPSNKSLISTSKGMSDLTTRDEVEFNVRCFVGSRCHGFGRAFLERFIFIKSFLNVVCSKVDQRVVNSQPRFSKNHIVLIQGKHSESLCVQWTENRSIPMLQPLLPCEVKNIYVHPPESLGRFCKRIWVRFSERSSWDFGRYGNYGIEGYNACKYRRYRTDQNLTRTFPKIVPKFVLQNLSTEKFLFVVWVSRLLLSTKLDDTKSCVDPQSIRTRASWPDKDPLNLNTSEEQSVLDSERLLIPGLPGTETEVPFPVSEFIVEVPGFKDSESDFPE